MTDKAKKPQKPAVQHAKGAAHETIGKLLGDDAAVQAGRDEQAAAHEGAAKKRT